MKKWSVGLAVLLVMLGVGGCKKEDDYERQIYSLKKTLEKPIGVSTDYFIMKRALGNGEAHPVILVFGYVDDLSVCQALLKTMRTDEKVFGSNEVQETMFFCQSANSN